MAVCGAGQQAIRTPRLACCSHLDKISRARSGRDAEQFDGSLDQCRVVVCAREVFARPPDYHATRIVPVPPWADARRANSPSNLPESVTPLTRLSSAPAEASAESFAGVAPAQMPRNLRGRPAALTER
jgi:hypothetical protein